MSYYKNNAEKAKARAARYRDRNKNHPFHGNLRSILDYFQPDPATGKIIRKTYTNNCGYIQTSYLAKTYYLHRLVWMSVHGFIPDNLHINHKNGIKTDNRLENLELVTRSENQRHSIEMGLRKLKSPEHKAAVHKRNRKRFRERHRERVNAYARDYWQKNKIRFNELRRLKYRARKIKELAEKMKNKIDKIDS